MSNWIHNHVLVEGLKPHQFHILLDWLTENPNDRSLLPCFDQERIDLELDAEGDVRMSFTIFTDNRPAVLDLQYVSYILKGPAFTFEWWDSANPDVPGCSGNGLIKDGSCSMDDSGVNPFYLSDYYRAVNKKNEVVEVDF